MALIGERVRVAVATATINELVELLEMRKKQVEQSKGSWRIRALGINDSIELLKTVKKRLREGEPEKAEAKSEARGTAEEAAGSEDQR
jgi:hypothetical protein